jgi:hypothetical protein
MQIAIYTKVYNGHLFDNVLLEHSKGGLYEEVLYHSL